MMVEFNEEIDEAAAREQLKRRIDVIKHMTSGERRHLWLSRNNNTYETREGLKIVREEVTILGADAYELQNPFIAQRLGAPFYRLRQLGARFVDVWTEEPSPGKMRKVAETDLKLGLREAKVFTGVISMLRLAVTDEEQVFATINPLGGVGGIMFFNNSYGIKQELVQNLTEIIGLDSHEVESRRFVGASAVRHFDYTGEHPVAVQL